MGWAFRRRQVLERIAAASDGPHPDLARVGHDLKEAERRIGRLVDAVENGTLSPEEVVDKLHRLREQRDSAKAVLAAAEGTSERLDPRAIGRLLDELGGLVVIGGELTRQEAAALFAAADLSIRYEPTARLATFTVDLAHGVSVRVGGGLEPPCPEGH